MSSKTLVLFDVDGTLTVPRQVCTQGQMLVVLAAERPPSVTLGLVCRKWARIRSRYWTCCNSCARCGLILCLAQVSTSSQATVIACSQFKRTHANETLQVYAVLVPIAFLCLSCATKPAGERNCPQERRAYADRYSGNRGWLRSRQDQGAAWREWYASLPSQSLRRCLQRSFGSRRCIPSCH